MAATKGPQISGNTGDNSEAGPVKNKRPMSAASLANLKPFKPGESGNISGRPKGTTVKEMLRRQLNRIVIGLDGQPSENGMVRGDLVADQVVRRAIAGDMRAAAIVFQFDQDRPTPFTQGEIIPGTNVQVNVNAQANAQIAESKESPERLEERVRAYYGLGPRRAGGIAADRSAAQG